MSDFDFLANIPLAASAATPTKPRRGRRKPEPSDDTDSSSEKAISPPTKSKQRRPARRGGNRSDVDSSSSSSGGSGSSDESSEKSSDEIKLAASPLKVSKSVPRHLEASAMSDRKRMASSETVIEKSSRRKDKASMMSSAIDEDADDSESDATAPITGDDSAASLDFLLGISFGASPASTRAKKANAKPVKSSRDGALMNSAPAEMLVGSYPPRQPKVPKAGTRDAAGHAAGAPSNVASKHGRHAKKTKEAASRTKPKLNYTVLKGEKISVKKNASTLLDSRFVIRSPGGFPMLVSSVIPPDRSKQRRLDNGDLTLLSESALAPLRLIRKRNSVSLAHLLAEIPEPYDANFLDHDIPTPDKYKITINLPSYRQSVIPWVKAGDLKKNQNTIFQEHHPWLRSNITLSKIRSVKRKIVEIAISKALDVAVVALSYVYFEKLILKNLVTKQNYKVVGAACLLLAEKFYGTRPKSFKFVIEALEKAFKVSSKEILAHGFTVYKDLAFSLFVDGNEVLPHLVKLQSSQDYLDHLFEYSALERKKRREQREKVHKKQQQQLQPTGVSGRRNSHSIDGVGMVINRGIYDAETMDRNIGGHL